MSGYAHFPVVFRAAAPDPKAVLTPPNTVLDATDLIIAAAVPVAAPTTSQLPIAFDSTAVTGGLYLWDGAAWVKVSTIP